MKSYSVQLEISGPIALWARPDTMPNPVSYVAPTFGAAKGIFEAILRWKSVNVRPIRCEICAPVQFHRYAFNYGGPLRKSDQMRNGSSLQVRYSSTSATASKRRWTGIAGQTARRLNLPMASALRTPTWMPSIAGWRGPLVPHALSTAEFPSRSATKP